MQSFKYDIKLQNCEKRVKPFKGDADDKIDRAAKGNVIEGEEEFGEEVGIEFTVQAEGPAVH